MEKPFDFIWRWFFVFFVSAIGFFIAIYCGTYLSLYVLYLLERIALPDWGYPLSRMDRYALVSAWAGFLSATCQIWYWWYENRKPKDFT
jgi:hypothetical protein